MGRDDLRVRDAGAGVHVIEVLGSLTGESEPAMRDEHTRIRSAGGEGIVLAFLPGASLDVGGLGSVVKLHAWADRCGQRLAAWGESPVLRWVFRVTRLDEGLPLWGREADALATAAGKRVEPPPVAPGPPEGDGVAAPWPAALEAGGAGPPPAGPLQGFGALWEKVHAIRLPGAAASPAQLAALWRERFGDFWPQGNSLRAPEGLRPGRRVGLTLATPGGALHTGVLVLHVDETSFSFLTLEGHLQAGWITFGAWDDGGVTVAEVRSLARAGDPLYEAGFLVAGHHQQEDFWHQTLESLGAHFGVRGLAFTRSVCIDPRRQWGQAANALHNAGLRSAFEAAAGFVSRVLPRRKD